MRYTPADIENLDIKKNTVGGLNEREVMDILSNVVDDYREYMNDIRKLTGEIDRLKLSLEEHKAMESTLQSAVLSVQQYSETIKKKAEADAELCIKDAEDRAAGILYEAGKEVDALREQAEYYRRQSAEHKTRYMNMLKNEMDMLMNDASFGGDFSECSAECDDFAKDDFAKDNFASDEYSNGEAAETETPEDIPEEIPEEIPDLVAEEIPDDITRGYPEGKRDKVKEAKEYLEKLTSGFSNDFGGYDGKDADNAFNSGINDIYEEAAAAAADDGFQESRAYRDDHDLSRLSLRSANANAGLRRKRLKDEMDR